MSISYLVPLVLLATVISAPAQVVAGIHKTKIGDVEITAIQDGEVKLDPQLLKGIKPEEAKAMLGGSAPVATSVNAFLVRTGAHLVLVDAGGAATAAYGNNLGHVVERLRQAGVNPEAIEAVLITHLHFDHVGGLVTADGKRAFPNAQIRMAQAEFDYWLDPARETGADERRKAMLQLVKSSLAPYLAAGELHPFVPEETPFPGITAVPLAGHTPGHTAYVVGKGKTAVWMIGDAVHFEKVQFKKPNVAVSFDTDSDQAIASRTDLWRRAAKEEFVVAGAHITFPGMGHVVSKGGGFVWVPLK